MHSLSPYTLRVREKSFQNAKNLQLGKIKGDDLFEILIQFMDSKSTELQLIETDQKVYKFESVINNPTERIICGWLQYGEYGVEGDILNIKTGDIDYRKAKENAEITDHFFYLYIPEEYDEGIALFHRVRGKGVKTIFTDLFNKYLLETKNCLFSANKLVNEQIVSDWQDASVKEIQLIKYKGYKDIADNIKGLGHEEQTLTLKPGRSKSMGTLLDLITPKSEKNKCIEILNEHCERIKSVVLLNGKRKTFSIANNSYSSLVCEIEAPRDLEFESGRPKFDSIKDWCKGEMDDFKVGLHHEG